MDKVKSIAVLNTLVEINSDRMESYETALEQTKEEELKILFLQFMQTSKRCRRQLVKQIQQLGGTPVIASHTSGQYFSAYMDTNAFLLGQHSRRILNAFESGDEKAIDIYHQALRNNLKDISAEQQDLLNIQYALIKADHDKLVSMRDMVMEYR